MQNYHQVVQQVWNRVWNSLVRSMALLHRYEGELRTNFGANFASSNLPHPAGRTITGRGGDYQRS